MARTRTSTPRSIARRIERPGVATARQLQGKELSYNNINDTDAAYECVAEFDPKRTAACVIVKHANPCGVAEGADLVGAYRKALACDTQSPYGGIIARQPHAGCGSRARHHRDLHRSDHRARCHRRSDRHHRQARRNLRLLLAGSLPDPRATGLTAKTVAGGLLVQSRDNAVVDDMTLKIVTKRAPTDAEIARSQIRLPRRQARQIQYHRLCQGSRHRRHRRRPDEPGGFGAHRRAQGAGRRRRCQAGRSR